MKKISGMFFMMMLITSFAFATNPTSNFQHASQNKLLATTCTATNCDSCWDQCTKSDDCGVGFNCSTTPCGNRCTQQ